MTPAQKMTKLTAKTIVVQRGRPIEIGPIESVFEVSRIVLAICFLRSRRCRARF